MSKTIIIKQQFEFRELLEWSTKNNMRNMGYKSNRHQRVEVETNGSFTFDPDVEYGVGEIYEVDIYHEVGMDQKYGVLVGILVYNERPHVYLDASLNEVLDDGIKEIHAYIDGRFYKIFDVFEE